MLRETVGDSPLPTTIPAPPYGTVFLDLATLGQAELRMFFLLRIVESSDICHEGELAIASGGDGEGR